MTFEDYQKRAITTDAYGGEGAIDSVAFMTKMLGLAGESGEVAEKVKKIHRNKGGQMSAEDKVELAKELGDVLWYLSAIAHYLDIPLETIAQKNIAKLSDRKARGVIKSKGDNR